MEENKNKINIITSLYEILQDNLAIVILGIISNTFKNIEAINAIEEFIMDFSPVLIYETYKCLNKYKLVDENEFYKSNDLKKKVKEYRMLTVRKKVKDSDYIKSIKEHMGIELKEDVFDINIVELNNEIKRFNFSEYNKEDDRDFLSSCYSTNTEFSKEILKRIMKITEKEYKGIINSIINNQNKDIKNLENALSGNRYSYKSSKLFLNSNITELDKVFILYRLNMIVILIELQKFLKKYKITIRIMDNIICDVHKFVSKIIALEIEIIGNDIRSLDTNFSRDLQQKLDNILLKENKEFYILNRKLRDNIHYGRIDMLDDKLYNNIIKLQNVYLNIVYREMRKNLLFVMNEDDIIMNHFLQYCNQNNIDKNELENNYEDYYTQYYFNKYIKRKL